MAVSKSQFLSVLVFLIAILTFIQLALASWLQDRLFTGPGVRGTNQATDKFVPITLISAVVGIASLLAASNRIKQWSKDGLTGADGATILIDLLLSLLAFGYACKEIDIENDQPSHHRDPRVQTLEAFVIIVALFKIIKLVTLHTDVTDKIFASD